jgi:hypothetical protein
MKKHQRFALLLGALFLVACGGDTKTVTEEVEVPMPQVTVTGDVAVLVGETATLTAATADGEDSAYTWASSDDAVATVDEAGLVTGVVAGTAIITATGVDTGASGSWGIHIYEEGEGPSATPRVFVSGAITVKVGETATLAAETVDGEDTGYGWESSDEAVATVDADGVVTGVAVGPVTITATGAETGESGSWNMYVWDEAEVVLPDPVVTLTGPMALTVGETGQVEAATENGEDTGYTYESSDEDAATVDETGLVTALAAGEVLITVTGVDTGATAIHGIVIIEEGVEVPFEELWAESGHADASAEAFRHWDEDEPAQVPTSCAKCHSSYGYLDYLGVDGTEFGVVDNPAAVDSVITCITCHNSATAAMDTVTFPSGAVISGLGAEARCMQCHQGRESTTSVNAAIEAAAPADDDTLTEGLGFKNVHYFAAGATLFGGEAMGGYQFEGKEYIGKFDHAETINGCADCHDPHTLEVKVEKCAACHAGVVEEADLVAARMPGSNVDFDGDGDAAEGIEGEILGLQEALYAAIQAYAADTLGAPLVYDSHAYPYFFKDTNGNGEVDEGEAAYANAYKPFSPNLLRAAYNYQYAQKDPGAFAHNKAYTIQLLFDSIEAVGGDVANLHRSGSGHFDGDSEAFRHWDEDGAVSASCAKCHSSAGFKFFAINGQATTQAQPASHGLSCDTCHTGVDYASGAPVRFIGSVEFPNGAVLENDAENPSSAFLCMNCHSGRTSGADVDAAIAANKLSFKNIHYLPVGASLNGADVGMGYEYEGKEYAGAFGHVGDDSAGCAYCHAPTADDHSFHVKLEGCTMCHKEATDGPGSIRKNRPTDYDGDGNTTEKLADELHTLADALYAAMLAKSADEGNPLVYDAGTYPYFFKDLNGNGEVDEGEASYANGYKAWSAETLKASFNFQFYQKEHGAWAHNTDYMAQLLYDSIEDLGGDVDDFNRP